MVANPERGEVALKVERGGETKEYVLKMSMNAAVVMQKEFKKPLAEIVVELQKLDVEVIRRLCFMLLQKYHKDEFTTVEKAGDLIDDVGGLGPFFAAFDQLVKINQPADGADGNPPKGAATPTTDGSTSSPDVTH